MQRHDVDTMMLTPNGTSAETIGNLLGEPKIALPDGYSKDRMDLFLQTIPICSKNTP